jgi:CBS domain-containing protein
LQVATARDVMTPTSRHLDETDSIAAAAVLMRELGVSAVPVCEGDGTFAGVITYRDIVVGCVAAGWDPFSTSTRELVDHRALTVAADEPIESALVTMAMNHVRRVPVVDGGSLVGMLADTDVARSLPDDSLGLLFDRRGA